MGTLGANGKVHLASMNTHCERGHHLHRRIVLPQLLPGPIAAVSVVLCASAGCSHEPAQAGANHATAKLEKKLSVDDVTAVKKVVPNDGPAYRAMLRFKDMECNGTATVKYSTGKVRPASR